MMNCSAHEENTPPPQQGGLEDLSHVESASALQPSASDAKAGSNPASHSKLGSCCIFKEYFNEYANMIDTLHIAPRLFILKRPFRSNTPYTLNLSIRNNALFPRLLEFSTDSPTDTCVSIDQHELNRYVQTDKVLNVRINMRCTSSKNINRRRHIFIHSFHPNIIFEVPIIVVSVLTEASICEHMVLPSTVPKNKSYYETIIYNPTKEPISIKYRNSYKGLKLNYLNNYTVQAEDYVKLLITFEPKKLQDYKGFFNIKFGMSPPRLVIFEYTPRSMGVYMNKGYVHFGRSKFNEESSRSIIVCNESPHAVKMKHQFHVELDDQAEANSMSRFSNNMFEEAISMHSILMYDFDDENQAQTIVYNDDAAKHFHLEVPDVIEAFSSHEIALTFRPFYDEEKPFPDDQDPPYFQRTRINFCFTDSFDCMQTHYVLTDGEISGIEIEMFPKTIDFRKIYLGEEHCAYIKVLNVDDVNAKVKYKDCLEPELCGLRMTPAEGFVLEPCNRGVFHLSLFVIAPARFNITLRFKVENGMYYHVSIKGTGQNVQLRTFPQLVEFGTVPFAVPQKRFMLLMNPLAVPITLQVHATEDGEEQPLIFNIRDSSKILPITVRDPIKELQRAHEDILEDVDLTLDARLSSIENDLLSEKSYVVNESEYSSEFEEEVMEPVPAMASRLLKDLKKQKVFDKSETDKRVIQEALQNLLETNYFSIFQKHNNFIFMDWNGIPSDPNEVYCDNEIIYLRPNTGRSITILIIPNRVGYFHRSLTVRICPTMPPGDSESSEDHQKTLIKSEYLCSKLWFEYNCSTPEIEWYNIVNLTELTIYAGEEYNFNMLFSNVSSVGGFLHFDVIPNEMSFRDGTWKFYIGSKSQVIAKCVVVFRIVGHNKLSGLLKIVGDPHPYPFHLYGNVLPTEVRITPMFVHRRVHVYEKNKVHFYIDNFSPTNTKLSMKLKDDRFQSLTVRGGMLAPTGQSMYTTMDSMFTDPDLYHNILYIDLQFDHVMEIPITFLVEGVPFYFDRNMEEGFDAGLLFTDLKEDFYAHKYKYKFKLKVFNRGLLTYRAAISRLKTYNPKVKSSACTNQPLTARFEIIPKLLEMQPNSEAEIEILISSYEEGEFFSDFLWDITEVTHPQRKNVIKNTYKATFVECDVSWDHKQLAFNYKPSQPLKERSHIETADLINYTNLAVDNVELEAQGPFRIKELFEHNFEKQIKVSLNSLERKEILVILNKAALKQLYCRQIEGRINVLAVKKMQKPLLLRLSVQVPEVNILQPELVLFDRGQPFDDCVEIINHGCSSANFKWKRIEVSENFVGDDDPADLVADVLSQILLTLEYNFTCEEESNMTLRYQQCRCQLQKETETGHLILDIIDEIISEIDLTNRRFIVRMDEVDALLDNSDVYSSSSFVRQTIDEILDHLNIESSQELSLASSEYCFSDRFIYFYEKCGLVPKLQHQSCLLHLPHIRRGHEVKSLFQLDIVGGRSQYFSVTLVNLAQKIKFHKDNIYLNIKPWYESFSSIIRISNVTKYPLQLLVMPMLPESKEKILTDGYAKLMQDEELELVSLGADKIKVNGILGLNENFLRSFGVLINNSANSYFRLRGQGVLPILNISTVLPKVEQSSSEILEEYSFMRKIYNYETFKSITEVDGDIMGLRGEEDDQEDSFTIDFSHLSESDEDMSAAQRRHHDYRLFQMVKTYVLVNNNQELPNATVLNQMLVTERYLHRLRINPELYDIHQKVYNKYISLHKTQAYKASNVKHFTVQPLPCEQLAYVLDLGPLTLNTLRRFELRLHFFGPGKLIASARTAVKVPGLYVDFHVENQPDKQFTYWAEKCNAPEFFDKGYRNMWERLLDASKSPRLNHAHSFDFDKLTRHQRVLTDRDRRMIEEYYNSLNPSVYPDQKHHFILAKVFTAYHSNFSGVEIKLVGLFKPESKYYERDQRIVDYIYIDLHMGPTLPILLRGVISA
ncbi:uncharacterized protein LOC117565950 isoform X2 [Drosophila albomicans]|uniref:Uncharacterized protein LOC117565950 isoform X2 n=1 Tax=Drosophila albomicans TaxID=7291 RepID=A0A6P8WC32_DROAB|nr:uncharacterized protein LOC117565950 isoform X2 [Drosophila albomicans]